MQKLLTIYGKICWHSKNKLPFISKLHSPFLNAFTHTSIYLTSRGNEIIQGVGF